MNQNVALHVSKLLTGTPFVAAPIAIDVPEARLPGFNSATPKVQLAGFNSAPPKVQLAGFNSAPRWS